MRAMRPKTYNGQDAGRGSEPPQGPVTTCPHITLPSPRTGRPVLPATTSATPSATPHLRKSVRCALTAVHFWSIYWWGLSAQQPPHVPAMHPAERVSPF